MEEKRNKKRQCQEDALEDEEIEQLINACKTKKEKFIIITLIYTGMRVSVFCSMDKDWIRWQKGVIHIPNQKGDWKPKTDSGNRDIPIRDVGLTTMLKEWFTLYDEVGMNRITVFRTIKRIADRTNINKKIYPHSLRATYATMLAFKGASESAVRYAMGWSQFKTAQSYISNSGARAIKEIEEKWKI